MRTRRRAAVALALALSALLAGCGKEPTAPGTNAVNDDKPNANQQVVAQGMFGNPASYTYIGGLGSGDDGNYAFYGYTNGQLGAGSLTGAGALRWFKTFTYVPRAARTLPGTAVVPNGVLVFGKHSTDADDDSERGDLTLYSSTGDLLSQVVLSSDSSDVFLNAAVPLTDSSFLAVGGERIAGVEWPWLVQIIVRSGGQLVRGGEVVLRPQLPGRSLVEVSALPAAGGEIRVFAVSSTPAEVDRVEALRITVGTIAPATADWTRDVAPTLGPLVVLNGIAASGDEVYVSGFTDDNRKGTTAGGGFWTSALMVSFTGTGDQRWRTVVGLTGHDEYFQDVLIDAGVAYGVGAAAAYIRGGRDWFGYGLVTKFDPASGTPDGSHTFGSDRFESEFEAAVLKGGNVVTGGWTEYEVPNGPYRGWLAELGPSVARPLGGLQSNAARRAAPDDGSRFGRTRHLISPWSRSGSR